MTSRQAHGLALRTPPSRQSAPPGRRRKSSCRELLGRGMDVDEHGQRRRHRRRRSGPRAQFRVRGPSVSRRGRQRHTCRRRLCNDRRRAPDRDHAMGGSDRKSFVPRRSRRHHRSNEFDRLRRNADLHAAAYRHVAGSDVLGGRAVVGRLHVLHRAAERHRQAADGRSSAACRCARRQLQWHVGRQLLQRDCKSAPGLRQRRRRPALFHRQSKSPFRRQR